MTLKMQKGMENNQAKYLYISQPATKTGQLVKIPMNTRH